MSENVNQEALRDEAGQKPFTNDKSDEAYGGEQGESFKDMLDKTFVSLHTGKVVRGEVVRVTPSEVIVDLGYKSDGIISKNEFSDDQSACLTEKTRPGDIFDVYVLRVNDGDGNVLVSKRRVDNQVNYRELEEACTNKTTLPGKITDLVKGGMIANILGCRAFVPASQISGRFEQNLESFVGREFNFNILEFDRGKRRIIAGRKELALQEAKKKREEVFGRINVGEYIRGTVSRLVDFGAFVDLGGVDGLVHVSEVSWKRVRKPSDVLTLGQEVNVLVIAVDPERGKISLTLRDPDNNPWIDAEEKYAIGSIIEGTVVRLAPFGAFVSLEDGIDGLVHISQIAHRRINRPEDVLVTGQTVSAKVMDIDIHNQKISLSIREVMDDDYDDGYDDDAEFSDGHDETGFSEAESEAEPEETAEARGESGASDNPGTSGIEPESETSGTSGIEEGRSGE